jgi:hypothetical protein
LALLFLFLSPLCLPYAVMPVFYVTVTAAAHYFSAPVMLAYQLLSVAVQLICAVTAAAVVAYGEL